MLEVYMTKYLHWLLQDEKIMESYIFLYLLNFMLLEDVAFISTEIGCKNRINKGNLGAHSV